MQRYASMANEMQILSKIPRFSIASRFICIQKLIEVEDDIAKFRACDSKEDVEALLVYFEKRHLITLILNYLVDPKTAITEVEFFGLLEKLEDLS